MEKIKQLVQAAGPFAVPPEILLRAINDLYSRQNLNSAAVAAGTTTTKLKTVNRIAYLIGGALCSFIATDDALIMATNTLSATQVGGYVITIDAAGVLYSLPLTPSATLAGLGSVVWPVCPVSQCVIALVMVNIVTASAATFTAGTTAWSTMLFAERKRVRRS